MQFGPGSVFFSGLTIPPAAPGTLLGADDGLSTDLATGTIAQLGQTIGRAGDPAALVEDREVPLNGHAVFFRNPAGNEILEIHPDGTISQANDTGDAYDVQWLIAPFAGSFRLFTDDAQDVVMTFNNSDNIVYTGDATAKFTVTAPWISKGYGSSAIRTLIGVLETFAFDDCTILYNDALGDTQLNIDPTLIPGQFGFVKKLGKTAAMMTLNALSGLIFSDGNSAATFVFGDPGECILFQSDGTNLYII